MRLQAPPRGPAGAAAIVALLVVTGALVALSAAGRNEPRTTPDPAAGVAVAAPEATTAPATETVPDAPGGVADRTIDPSTNPPAAGGPAPATHGMVVAVDPETGELGVPSPEQMRTLFPETGSAMVTPALAPVEILGPGGAVGLDLRGQMQEYVMVTIGPDGRPVFRCTHDPSDPAHAHDHAPPAPPALEER